MKIFVSFLLISSAVFCEKYTTKYDNIDVDEILSSERLLNNYFACLMDKGPCTPDASELKKVLPDALQTSCTKCSDKQKESTKKIVKFLVDKKPNLWKNLTAKYDPDNLYFDKFRSDFGL